ncbi:hypothetical protein [Micavibrio aeruginosavorus]|uniref:hypothetical protein n=1 Tax=Micavibrio aeruginosavorus TaxID=349221 RepID=UPI0005A041CA|nr:hypothetical protein [Micavibrio aeruginosavorus]
MYRVDYTDEAKSEIREFFQDDPIEAGVLVAALEELNKQDYPPDELLVIYKKAKYPSFECGFFLHAFEKDGLRIWSLKVYLNDAKSGHPEAIGIRALIAPCHKHKKYIVLAARARRRDVCYKTKGERYEKLVKDYYAFGCDQ